MTRPSSGCLQTAAIRANSAGQQGGEEVEEADAQEADEAVHAAKDAAVQGADLLLVKRRQVDLHQVRDDADAHVAVDARAGVLDQVAAQDVEALAQQVKPGDEAEEPGGGPVDRVARPLVSGAVLDVVDQRPQEQGHAGVAGAGDGHDQGGHAEGGM